MERSSCTGRPARSAHRPTRSSPSRQISGASAQFFETPAAATSRIINERLQTDLFLTAVAENAGIGCAVESGVIDLGVIRQSVWASANGDSILSVNAQWADPQVSYNLAAAIIKQYQTFLTDTVASDATAADDFYTSQLEELNAERRWPRSPSTTTSPTCPISTRARTTR